ncbi:hypothetical protein B6D60_04305 [candidate division KSB1 bacterium 4484_87]|nr:MAG: hypothetical protein B6D60_04305 [candidate division KSB1 bacterium 4484_87]
MSANSKIKIFLMGGNLIACKILRHLFRMRNVSVTLVVASYEDNGAETNQNIWNASLVRTALSKGLKVIQPFSLNSPEFLQEVFKLERPDLIITADYNHFLNKELLALPKIGAINVHFSKLPRHRGYLPYVWSVLEDNETGVTLHWINDKINGGDIIAQQTTPVGDLDTAYSLYLRLTKMAIKLFAKYFSQIISGKAPRIPQDEKNASYHPMGYPYQGLIDWRLPAEKIRRFVQALTFPGMVSPITYLSYMKIPIEILAPVAVIPKNSSDHPEPGMLTDVWTMFDEPVTPVINEMNGNAVKEFGATIQTGNGQILFNYFRIQGSTYRMKAHKLNNLFDVPIGAQLSGFKELKSQKNMNLIISDYFPVHQNNNFSQQYDLPSTN